MKNLYIILFCLLMSFYSYSQQYITWNPQPPEANTITGTYGAGTLVTVTTQGPGANVGLESPASNTNNLVTNIGANTFDTNGPGNNNSSQTLVFTFNPPVYITQYNMSDIDRGGTWNDSFNFVNINYASNNPTNTTTTLNGANVTNDPNNSGGFSSWFCSSTLIQNFSLNFVGDNGNLTHEFLGYSIEVLVPPALDPVCLGDTPAFPLVGNNISGSWNPSIINTNSVGTTSYTFTPNAGQVIQCPIVMPVTVNDCCIPTLTSNITVSTMLQEERGDWIRSTDVVTFSDGIFGNGVVYHALNFVELNPGFDAITGSQFVAYPQDCTGNYVYRQENSGAKNENVIESEQKNKGISIRNNLFDIITDASDNFIEIPITDYNLTDISIYSLSGRRLFIGKLDEEYSTKIDITSFNNGIYLVQVISRHGETYSQKFIKKQ